MKHGNRRNPKTRLAEVESLVTKASITFNGRTVQAVLPVLQKDCSGFYVPPTTLNDRSIADEAEQSGCVNSLPLPQPSRRLVAADGVVELNSECRTIVNA